MDMTHLSESSAVRLEELRWICSVKSKVWSRERWGWVRYIPTRRGVVRVYAKGRKETPRALARVCDLVRCTCYKECWAPLEQRTGSWGTCWRKGNGP